MTMQEPKVVGAARTRRLLTVLSITALTLVGAMTPVPSWAQQPVVNAPPPANATGEETVKLSRFAEPVDLRVLIDYISDSLNVNILIDPSLSGQSVAISGDMEIPKSKLFQFLQLILEPTGFVVTHEPDLDTYNIRAGGNVPLKLQGELATTVLIPTPMVSPSALKPAVDAALGEVGASRVSYIDELGVILSTGSPRANRQLHLIVDQLLDNLKLQTLNMFPLEHIAAEEARDRLLSITGGGSQQGGRGGRPASGAAATGGTTSAGGAFSNLEQRLIIPQWGNQLIYKGTPGEAEEFALYLAIVDVPNTLEVRRYAAGEMVSTVTAIGSSQGLGPVVGSGGSASTGQAFNAGRAASAGAASSNESAGSRFVVENAESGIFLYYGTLSQHLAVDALIKKFAGQVTPDLIVVEFYKLKHATAPEVADVLSGLLDITNTSANSDSPFLPGAVGNQRGINRLSNQTQGVTEGDEATRAAQQAAADESGAATLGDTEGIGITADEPNNQLIVRASLKQQADIQRIINRLDQRRPMVYIEAHIISVSANEDFTITVDTALTDPDLDVPVFTNFGLAEYGTTTVNTALQGITAALVKSNYIPIIINAIANDSDGRTESNPHILINDNEEADLSSTTNQAFSQTTQSSGNPVQTSVGGNVSAGTTLTVRPQISAGGYIKLEYTIELSTFVPGTRSANLPSDTQTNTFTSQVNVPSGSTVVVGGFIQKSESVAVSKIPFIGDIPLIGLLFQDRTETEQSRMIYVFITPKILRDPTFQDLRLLTAGPRQGVELDEDLPPLEPQMIPIFFSSAASARVTPQLQPIPAPTQTTMPEPEPEQPTDSTASVLPAIIPSFRPAPSRVNKPEPKPVRESDEDTELTHAITSQRGAPL